MQERNRDARTAGDLPVERLIARLYRSALSVPPHEFRSWALKQVAALIPYDGALWGSGSRKDYKFHTVTVIGLPPEFPAVLEATRSLNPILPKILSSLDTPVAMEDVVPDETFFKSELYRTCFEKFGIARILSTAHADARSGLLSLLTLYRHDRKRGFTANEKDLQHRLIFHLFQAASHAYFLHLGRTLSGRPAGSAAAVVDRQGFFLEAQPRFLDLIEQHFPQHPPAGLPFALPLPGKTDRVGALCVKSEALGDFISLYLWTAGPLDRLTAREREIIYAVTQGLSFKQAARKIGVAPSTVANHLYRVYRKLGVSSRSELADLVFPAAAS